MDALIVLCTFKGATHGLHLVGCVCCELPSIHRLLYFRSEAHSEGLMLLRSGQPKLHFILFQKFHMGLNRFFH